jgi:hypothetical protein
VGLLYNRKIHKNPNVKFLRIGSNSIKKTQPKNNISSKKDSSRELNVINTNLILVESGKSFFDISTVEKTSLKQKKTVEPIVIPDIRITDYQNEENLLEVEKTIIPDYQIEVNLPTVENTINISMDDNFRLITSIIIMIITSFVGGCLISNIFFPL